MRLIEDEFGRRRRRRRKRKKERRKGIELKDKQVSKIEEVESDVGDNHWIFQCIVVEIEISQCPEVEYAGWEGLERVILIVCGEDCKQSETPNALRNISETIVVEDTVK